MCPTLRSWPKRTMKMCQFWSQDICKWNMGVCESWLHPVNKTLVLSPLEQGSPTSRILLPDDLRWSWYKIKVEIKYTTNVMCSNYPETVTHPHLSVENCLPWSWSLVPKRLKVCLGGWICPRGNAEEVFRRGNAQAEVLKKQVGIGK